MAPLGSSGFLWRSQSPGPGFQFRAFHLESVWVAQPPGELAPQTRADALISSPESAALISAPPAAASLGACGGSCTGGCGGSGPASRFADAHRTVGNKLPVHSDEFVRNRGPRTFPNRDLISASHLPAISLDVVRDGHVCPPRMWTRGKCSAASHGHGGCP